MLSNICPCRRNGCECRGQCLCYPCICDCFHCLELRLNQNRRGYQVESQATTAASEQPPSLPYMENRTIWIGPLPNLDFLSNKPSACGSGESSSSTRHVSQTPPERSSSEEIMFQMDDLDNLPDKNLEKTTAAESIMHHNISHSSLTNLTTSVSQPEELQSGENPSVVSSLSSESCCETLPSGTSSESLPSGLCNETPPPHLPPQSSTTLSTSAPPIFDASKTSTPGDSLPQAISQCTGQTATTSNLLKYKMLNRPSSQPVSKFPMVRTVSDSSSSIETLSISDEIFVNGQNCKSPSYSALSNILSTAQAGSTSAETSQTGSLSQIENLKLSSPEISKSPTSSTSSISSPENARTKPPENIGTEQSVHGSSPIPEKDKETEEHS